MEIPDKRARLILENFDHNIELLANYLIISNNNKLVLLNPHYMPPAVPLSGATRVLNNIGESEPNITLR